MATNRSNLSVDSILRMDSEGAGKPKGHQPGRKSTKHPVPDLSKLRTNRVIEGTIQASRVHVPITHDRTVGAKPRTATPYTNSIVRIAKAKQSLDNKTLETSDKPKLKLQATTYIERMNALQNNLKREMKRLASAVREGNEAKVAKHASIISDHQSRIRYFAQLIADAGQAGGPIIKTADLPYARSEPIDWLNVRPARPAEPKAIVRQELPQLVDTSGVQVTKLQPGKAWKPGLLNKGKGKP